MSYTIDGHLITININPNSIYLLLDNIYETNIDEIIINENCIIFPEIVGGCNNNFKSDYVSMSLIGQILKSNIVKKISIIKSSRYHTSLQIILPLFGVYRQLYQLHNYRHTMVIEINNFDISFCHQLDFNWVPYCDYYGIRDKLGINDYKMKNIKFIFNNCIFGHGASGHRVYYHNKQVLDFFKSNNIDIEINE